MTEIQYIFSVLRVKNVVGTIILDLIFMISLDLSLLHKANKENDKARECVSEAIRIMEQSEAEGYFNLA